MSIYYDISISHRIFSDIEDAILTAISHTDETFEVIDLVHLLDAWYNLQEEASAKNNEELKKWMEQQKLFEENKVDDIFLFHKIKKVVKDLNLDVENEFYLICDISDVLKEKMEDTDGSKIQ